MTSIKPNDGDFVVVNSQWSIDRYAVRRVIKVTAQLYFYKEGSGRERRARMDEIFFSSADETAANKLAEKLKSSHALHEEEKRKSYDRWQSRLKNLLALTVPSTSRSSEAG